MRREFLITIGAIIFLMAFFYWQDHFIGSGNMQPSTAVADDVTKPSAPQESFSTEAAAEASADATPPKEVNVEARRLFVASLKEMAQCLQIKNTIVEAENAEPTLENLLISLRPALGEMTVFTDDWTQTDIQFADGVSKRIRTEINYDHPGNPTRYLQVYKMNEQKIPEMEDLEADQSMNPSDEFIESLKVGSNISLSEKGGRAYFQGGEEMAVIEQNGQVDSFTMTRNNKTISCSAIVSGGTSGCQCY